MTFILKLLFFLFLAVAVFAQEPPVPPKPQPTVSVKMHWPGQNTWWMQPLPVPHRTADRSFWAHVLIATAANVADFEYTQHQLAQGGREVNPIFGAHPSRLRMYGTALPVEFGADLLAWHWKRQDDALAAGYHFKRPLFQRWWWIVDVQTAAHLGGLGYSATH